jgi:hypothetical protein
MVPERRLHPARRACTVRAAPLQLAAVHTVGHAMQAFPRKPLERGTQRRLVWGGAACLLLAPAIAMRFTREVDWNAGDFLVMGAMLASACGLWDLATPFNGNRAYRGAVAVAVVGAFLMTWINLAVGIIGSEHDPLNQLFFGVLLVGLAGASLARFRAAGMARAMLAMAVAQAAMAVLTLAVHGGTFLLSVFFAAAWLLSAALFRRAAAGEGGRTDGATPA